MVALYCIVALGISFIVTFYLIPPLAAAAIKLHIVDHPDGKLKNHKVPTPYLGGIATYIGFITALCLVFPYVNDFFLFLLGTTLLLFIGLLDDLVVMNPHQKFLGQCIALICFLKGGFFLKAVFFSTMPHYLWSYFWLFISAGWILSVINAFNLVDVMDGLATTLAMSITLSFLVVAFLFNLPLVMILLCSFLGALLAFFYFNKPVARIYLGDAGSLFIGGIIAVIPFLIPWGTYTPCGFLAPAIILFMPLCEVGTLILVRMYKGIPFYRGSPDHFSHYLQHKGWSKQAVLGYVIMMQAVITLLTIGFVYYHLSLTTFLAGILLLASWWYGALCIPFTRLKLVALLKFLKKTATRTVEKQSF